MKMASVCEWVSVMAAFTALALLGLVLRTNVDSLGHFAVVCRVLPLHH